MPAAQPGVASCTTGLELFTAPGQQLAFLQARGARTGLQDVFAVPGFEWW